MLIILYYTSFIHKLYKLILRNHDIIQGRTGHVLIWASAPSNIFFFAQIKNYFFRFMLIFFSVRAFISNYIYN